MKKLDQVDSAHLLQLEHVIENGKRTFVSVGLALEEIRQNKLYREQYPTFEEYCQKRWGWGARRGRQLINSALVAESLPKQMGTIVPILNEAQARAIAQVPEEDRTKVLKLAEKAGDMTAAAIAEAAEKVEGAKPARPVEEVIELDGTGFRIPNACIEYWRRSGEIQELLTAVSRIKTKLETKRAEDDVLFRNISQAVVNELALAYSFIANAKPYAVCLNCQGKLKDSCRGCKGTGFMAKFAYEHEQVKGLRTMREAVMAKGKT